MSRHITLRAEISEVARLNVWLKDRFAESGLPDRLAGDIKLCLNEAVTNTISYGYPDGGDGEVVVKLDIGQDSATAVLVDNGIAFNPLDVPDAAKIESLETATIGGFGVKLMRELTRAMTYERDGDLNRLTMRFAAA